MLDTAGIATTWGAEFYRDRVPEKDAAVTAKLNAAGAVLVAKLSLGALALNDMWFGGQTKNPWNLDEGASGSSAGPGSGGGGGAGGVCDWVGDAGVDYVAEHAVRRDGVAADVWACAADGRDDVELDVRQAGADGAVRGGHGVGAGSDCWS